MAVEGLAVEDAVRVCAGSSTFNTPMPGTGSNGPRRVGSALVTVTAVTAVANNDSDRDRDARLQRRGSGGATGVLGRSDTHTQHTNTHMHTHAHAHTHTYRPSNHAIIHAPTYPPPHPLTGKSTVAGLLSRFYEPQVRPVPRGCACAAQRPNLPTSNTL